MDTHPEQIDAATLQSWLESGRKVDVIDIRPKSDYNEWHVPGSHNVDAYHHIYARRAGPLEDYQAPDGVPVVAVCFVGQTSQVAAHYLRSRGMQAMSLIGGMQAWSLAWNVAQVSLAKSKAEVLQVRRTGKGCLSYLLASEGEAVVIDPSTEPSVYLDLAQERSWRVTKVLDTHVHADHLSRARRLAEAAGAEHFLPEQHRTRFEFSPIQPGAEFRVGGARLEALPTPGHTFESMSFVLDGEAIFTGDTLFLEGVGRPDLMADRAETEQRARLLHRSLQTLAGLDPELIVLPCHSSRPVPFDRSPMQAALGSVVERLEAFGQTEDEFIAWILGRIPPTPPNHVSIVGFNESGVWPSFEVAQLEAGANLCAV